MTTSEHLRALYASLDGLLSDLDANGTPESAAASLKYHLKNNGLVIREAEAAAPASPDVVEALRLPWHRETAGHLSTAGIVRQVAADLDVPLAEGLPPNTDATWIINADNKVIAFVGNGPRQTHNADAIIAAIAALPAAAPAPLDERRLIEKIEHEKRGTIRYPEDIGHDMGMAHAQDIIRRESRRAATPPTDEQGNA